VELVLSDPGLGLASDRLPDKYDSGYKEVTAFLVIPDNLLPSERIPSWERICPAKQLSKKTILAMFSFRDSYRSDNSGNFNPSIQSYLWKT